MQTLNNDPLFLNKNSKCPFEVTKNIEIEKPKERQFIPSLLKTNDENINDMLQNINESDDSDDWLSLLNDLADDSKESAYNNDITSLYSENSFIDLEVKMVLGSEKSPQYNICTKCNIEGIITDGSIYCPKCGIKISALNECSFSYLNGNDHNNTNESFMSFNFTGKNSYCYQRSFLKTCANYSLYRKNTNRKEMDNYNYQHEGNKIPKNAIKYAIELFSKIKESGYVFRGNGKKGVFGACLFYACIVNYITKTPREIASVMKIEDRFLSRGDSKLQELNGKGVISIPTIVRPIYDYINQLFPVLQIPCIYKQFVIDIIEISEGNNIHINNDSRPTTKCVGSIYLLINRVKNLKHITNAIIIKECDISKSTFIRYYNLLLENYKIIKPVFRKHRIPMPLDWKAVKPLE